MLGEKGFSELTRLTEKTGALLLSQPKYWLEALHPDHFPNFLLEKCYTLWGSSKSEASFWDWIATQKDILLTDEYQNVYDICQNTIQ